MKIELAKHFGLEKHAKVYRKFSDNFPYDEYRHQVNMHMRRQVERRMDIVQNVLVNRMGYLIIDFLSEL